MAEKNNETKSKMKITVKITDKQSTNLAISIQNIDPDYTTLARSENFISAMLNLEKRLA